MKQAASTPSRPFSCFIRSFRGFQLAGLLHASVTRMEGMHGFTDQHIGHISQEGNGEV